MKRTIIFLAVMLGLAAAAAAQPKAAGVRIGTTGLEAVYLHNLSKDAFIEGNIGFDFGVDSGAGFKITGLYNVVCARPAWTNSGSWAIYAGAGVSLGNVYDMVSYKVLDEKKSYPDNGFMVALTGQVGLEYNFDFPLQLAVDMRPYLGMHINDGKFRIPETDMTVDYESKAGFYGNGLLGFIPTLSVRYRF